MAKPVILAVDDEPAVLSAIARDLRRAYGERYRILQAGSGEAALEALRQLKMRDEPVALFVVDQRMPGLTGVELLQQAIELYPDAKRVLLTAYADTQAAIDAINVVRLNHYLMKPWDPPEERLYPVLDDLLDDWQADSAPPQESIRVVGSHWSPDSHRVKDFFARHLVPYRWVDVEASEEHQRLLESMAEGEIRLPLVFFPDGTRLDQPSNVELAEKLGLQTRAVAKSYDLIVVGAGPAGLAAAVYGASEGLETLVLESDAPGGQAGMSSAIENYLGFPVGLSGGDLARRAVAQARRFGAELLNPVEAVSVRAEGPHRIVRLTDGSELTCRALVIATGVAYRTLPTANADRLTGAGVYYGAAITEALACQGQDIFIVGAGNSAGQAAMYLSRYARSVTILVRGGSLRATMSAYLVSLLERTPNVSVRCHVEVTDLHGERRLEAITLADSSTGQSEIVPAWAVFIFIGTVPRTDWISSLVQTGPQGFILTGADCLLDGKLPRGWGLQRGPFWLETSVPGIFAAGDVRHRSVKRIASAVGEGAMAVQFVQQHLHAL